MHVAQINFLPAPEGCSAAEVFAQWPSLVDIPEAVAMAGVRVSVIQAAARDERVARNGVDYHFVDVAAVQSVATRGRYFAGLLADIGADVLHVHGLGFAEEAFAVAQSLPRLPILFQDHADRPPPWWRRPRWRRWYAVASGVAFTAPELAQPFRDAGVLPTTAHLFAIPESSSRFVRGNRTEARAATGLHGDPGILWVGHLNAGKDPLTVLDGVAHAASRLPDPHVWCAFGSAPLLEEVKQRVARDPRLAGRVHLLGKVPHAGVQILMQAADLFVSGSHAESCGYVVLEALACGITPVVTDIPSFRALTGDGVGHLWPPGDASGLSDALVRAAASRPSPDRVRAYFDDALSFTAVGRRWAGAYAQLFDDARRRTA